jgi:ribose transport system substrate-binding protein
MQITTATKRLAIAAALGASAIAVTACGGSSSAGTNAAASSAVSPSVISTVREAMAPANTFPDPSSHIRVPSGKRIVAITCSSQGYGCVQGAMGVQAAGKALGWNVTVVDGKGDPSVWNSAIQQAVVDHANGIVLTAINPALVQGALARAKAAGIPVEETFIPRFPGPSVDGYVTTNHVEGGKILADWIIKDAGGKANILMLNEPEFPELVQRNKALLAELKANCPGCKVLDTVQLNIGTMAQQLPGAVTSALQSNPGIDYVVAPFDSAAIFAAQGIRQAGKTGRLKLVSAEGDPNGIEGVQSGAQAADLATAPPWGGWAAVDLLARDFAGHPIRTEVLPQRLLVKSNVPSGKGWSGDVDYQAKFMAAWGR